MAAALGIFNPQPMASEASAGAKARPMAAQDSGSSDSSSSATISANDFLTLLVTEMQNQDPTAATDPNEYINQLVNVNSLQQLIAINGTLSGALGGPATTGQATAGTGATGKDGVQGGPQVASTPPAGTTAGARMARAAQTVAGNLSVPEARPAANRVANALGGRTQVY